MLNEKNKNGTEFILHDTGVYNFNAYEIDWDTVRTFDDMLYIMRGIQIVVYESSTQYDHLKPFLKKIDKY